MGLPKAAGLGDGFDFLLSSVFFAFRSARVVLERIHGCFVGVRYIVFPIILMSFNHSQTEKTSTQSRGTKHRGSKPPPAITSST
jgi:hypothetical protein